MSVGVVSSVCIEWARRVLRAKVHKNRMKVACADGLYEHAQARARVCACLSEFVVARACSK